MNDANITREFSATGIVLNERRQALLIFHKKLQVWLPPGGHIEPNELPDEAVLREIYEETGVRATLLPNGEKRELADRRTRVLAQPYCVFLEEMADVKGHFHVDFIYCCYAEHQAGQHSELEAEAMGWFEECELDGLDMYYNAREVVRSAMKEAIL